MKKAFAFPDGMVVLVMKRAGIGAKKAFNLVAPEGYFANPVCAIGGCPGITQVEGGRRILVGGGSFPSSTGYGGEQEPVAIDVQAVLDPFGNKE
eukprot:12457099-Ditylum_brightwellii.AAC.1